ncbi:MAG: AgmX/PglI C-terminal domain-containing protein [Pseudomonadota bacterium]
MSMSAHPLSADLVLPWTIDEQQEQKFYKGLRYALIGLLLFSLVVPWLPVFESEYKKPEKPIVKTKVLLKNEVVKPKVKQPPKIEKPKPKKKAEPKKPDKPKPPPKDVPKKGEAKTNTKTRKQEKPKAPVDKKAALSQSHGLQSLASELAALRGSSDVRGLKKKAASNSQDGKVARADRSVLGENTAVKTSEGIRIDDKIMKASSTDLVAHTTKKVEGITNIGIADFDSPSSKTKFHGSSTSSQSTRDLEGIRGTIERHKGRLYELYNKARTKNPDLSGQFVFRLVIEPDGSISDLRLVSSELGEQDLEQKMLAQLQKVNFGNNDGVVPTSVEYKFIFVPS